MVISFHFYYRVFLLTICTQNGLQVSSLEALVYTVYNNCNQTNFNISMHLIDKKPFLLSACDTYGSPWSYCQFMSGIEYKKWCSKINKLHFEILFSFKIFSFFTKIKFVYICEKFKSADYRVSTYKMINI